MGIFREAAQRVLAAVDIPSMRELRDPNIEPTGWGKDRHFQNNFLVIRGGYRNKSDTVRLMLEKIGMGMKWRVMEKAPGDKWRKVVIKESLGDAIGVAINRQTAYVRRYGETGFSVLWDEPIGIAIGFKPADPTRELTLDKITVLDGGGEYYFYDKGNDTYNVVSVWFPDCEPQDNYVWRSQKEFEEWYEDMFV